MSTEAFFGGVILFSVIIVLISIVVAVITIIANYKIFQKAGEEGWKAIIPVYNSMTLCKIVGLSQYWIIALLIVSFISGILGAIFSPLGYLATIASIYVSVVQNLSLARSFNKSDGFAVGLILLPVVFYPILGFGKDEFAGATPFKEPLDEQIRNIFNDNKNTSPKQENTNNKFCPNCGAKVPGDSSFCQSCGNKIN